jgi:hypothetical protein
MRISSLGLIIFIVFVHKVKGQTISNNEFQKLLTDSTMDYKDSLGKSLGCGMSLECWSFSVYFYDVKFDKKRSELSIKACTYLRANERDTTRLSDVNVLLATPLNKKLIKVITLGSSSSKSKEGEFPNRRGDVLLRFRFDRKNKLYFVNSMCQVIEYNINRLID